MICRILKFLGEVGMAFVSFKNLHANLVRGHFQALLGGVLGFICFAAFSSACSNEKPKKPVSVPLPVTVSAATQKTVPVQLRAIGNVQAYSTVTVKSKGGGGLGRVPFTEGQGGK